MCAYPDPATGEGKGIGVPVLILVAVAIALTVVAKRTRFGRHVFAYASNPEAVFLSGLPVKRVVFTLFMPMGARSPRRSAFDQPQESTPGTGSDLRALAIRPNPASGGH